jgi:hypothetical protein
MRSERAHEILDLLEELIEIKIQDEFDKRDENAGVRVSGEDPYFAVREKLQLILGE